MIRLRLLEAEQRPACGVSAAVGACCQCQHSGGHSAPCPHPLLYQYMHHQAKRQGVTPFLSCVLLPGVPVGRPAAAMLVSRMRDNKQQVAIGSEQVSCAGGVFISVCLFVRFCYPFHPTAGVAGSLIPVNSVVCCQVFWYLCWRSPTAAAIGVLHHVLSVCVQYVMRKAGARCKLNL